MDKNVFNFELGLLVRNERKRQRLSQEELAFRANCGLSQIGTVERGEKGISFYNFYKIAKALNIDVNDLLKEIDKKIKAV